MLLAYRYIEPSIQRGLWGEEDQVEVQNQP